MFITFAGTTVGKIQDIKDTREKLEEHEAEISKNENFEFEVTFTKFVEEDVSGTGSYSTNCQQCQHTCHYPCSCPATNDADKRRCSAMDSDGNCTQCPGNCHWKEHCNQEFRWNFKEVTEKQTAKEVKEKYLKDSETKRNVDLTRKLRTEQRLVYKELMEQIRSFTERANKLQESTEDHSSHS